MATVWDEAVKELLEIQLSKLDFDSFTEEEVSKLGCAAEQGFCDWEQDQYVRENWETPEDAEYSYFYAMVEELNLEQA